MVVAWSKVIEWKQWEVVGFWLNSEGRINSVCWCMYLGMKDGGQAWLGWTTARMELPGLIYEIGEESKVWRAEFEAMTNKVLLIFHAALPLLAPECSWTWAVSPSTYVPGTYLRLSFRALLIFASYSVSLESDPNVMPWPVSCLEGSWESSVSWDLGGKVSEEFGWSLFTSPAHKLG